MMEISNKLCHDISRLTIAGNHEVSCSIGITSCTNKKTFDNAYKFADNALYKAKRQGKNCIVLE